MQGLNAHPSCEGQVPRELSSAAQSVDPSISITTIGSSNGKISKISPRVTSPVVFTVWLAGLPVVTGSYVHSANLVHRQCPLESCLHKSARRLPRRRLSYTTNRHMRVFRRLQTNCRMHSGWKETSVKGSIEADGQIVSHLFCSTDKDARLGSWIIISLRRKSVREYLHGTRPAIELCQGSAYWLL